jgi:hypothetical protein
MMVQCLSKLVYGDSASRDSHVRLFPFLVTLATIYFFAPRVCFPYSNTTKMIATAAANATSETASRNRS